MSVSYTHLDAYLEHGTAKIIKVGDKTDFTAWDMFANNPGNQDGGNLVGFIDRHCVYTGIACKLTYGRKLFAGL